MDSWKWFMYFLAGIGILAGISAGLVFAGVIVPLIILPMFLLMWLFGRED